MPDNTTQSLMITVRTKNGVSEAKIRELLEKELEVIGVTEEDRVVIVANKK